MSSTLRLYVAFSCLILLVFFKAYAVESDRINLNISFKHKSFSLPVPQGKLLVKSTISVFAGGELTPAKISYSLLWPKKSSESRYVRVLNIELEKKITTDITLAWQKSNRRLKKTPSNTLSNAVTVYPNKNWLRKVLLLTDNQGVDETWYRHVQTLKAVYLADERRLTKNKYPKTVGSQWLYDRPQAFYQLFLSGGDSQFKVDADRFVAYYKSQLNEDGYFKLSKPKDVKYLMGRALVYDYLLNRTPSSLQALKSIFEASLSWKENYNGRGFWTERHHAAALNVAISYWEVSGNEDAKQRVIELIQGIVRMTFEPDNDWRLRDCPQHTFSSHEGWGDDSPVCSPWMMALLADGLWRYYLLTDDANSAELLSAFATFMLNEGIYYGTGKKLAGRIIPKYIVSLDNNKQEELEPYSDLQHTCDVAGMIGKGVYIKKQLNKEMFLEGELFRVMSELCKKEHLAIVNKYKYKKLTYLTSRPPRKFNWEYSSTDDLPWLMHLLIGTESS